MRYEYKSKTVDIDKSVKIPDDAICVEKEIESSFIGPQLCVSYLEPA